MEAAGRYRIRRRIARGGMAEVFEAVALGASGFERKVALKRMLPMHDTDPSFARMFVDEARIASRLHHANIVAVLDYGVVDGRPFQVLELVDGMDLHHLVRLGEELGEPMPEGVALFVCSEVAQALHHAHGATDDAGRPLGIVHRDVSTANVLVSWSGDVKLSDFGIAFAHARDEITQGGVTKGKLTYMSPEQATAGDVDSRADIFATGVMLHVLLTGKSPLSGADAFRKLFLDGELDLDPGLPGDVRAIVARATKRDREARHRTAAELADQILDRVAERLTGDPRRVLREWLGRVRPARPATATVDALDGGELDLVLDERASGDVQTFHAVPLEPTDPASSTRPSRAEARPRWAWPLLALAVIAGVAVAVPLALEDGATAARTPAEPVSVSPPAPEIAPDPPPEAEPPPVVAPDPPPAERPAEPRPPRRRAPPEDEEEQELAPSATGVLVVGGAGAHQAEIFVDGESVGYAPKRVELSVGEHRVELVTPGGERIARRIEVTARHTRSSPVRFDLP